MKRLLAIDPGLRHLGWALYADAQLERAGLACGLVDSRERGPIAWRAVVADIPTGLDPSCIVGEFPQVYSVRNTRPDDLLQLASVLGAVAQRWTGTPMVTLLPREWKGQRPKEATTYQANQTLSVVEAHTLSRELRAVPATLQHNVLDAVALGLVYLQRMR